MFPEGDHYAKSKGEKINSMMACRSSDHGKTRSKLVVAYDIPYGQHGFIPLILRGTPRIHCFGTQPVLGKWTWEEGENARMRPSAGARRMMTATLGPMCNSSSR